jgi:fluoride exporter
MTVLAIAAGGALGTLARYGLGLWLARVLGLTFPYGTLAVNVIGSFALGVVAGVFAGSTVLGTDARLVLGVGFLGGFTTYSSFNLELLRLFGQGDHAKAGAYLCTTVLGCLAAGALGLWLARVAVTSG